MFIIFLRRCRMGIKKISDSINKMCKDDKNMKGLLLDLFNFELEERGWWKETYREIITKHAEEDGE